jgi:hypothetical protein
MKSYLKSKINVFALALVAALSVIAAPAAFADGTFSTGVVTAITSAQTDVTTIGVAVLAVIVLVCAIGWAGRAMKK